MKKTLIFLIISSIIPILNAQYNHSWLTTINSNNSNVDQLNEYYNKRDFLKIDVTNNQLGIFGSSNNKSLVSCINTIDGNLKYQKIGNVNETISGLSFDQNGNLHALSSSTWSGWGSVNNNSYLKKMNQAGQIIYNTTIDNYLVDFIRQIQNNDSGLILYGMNRDNSGYLTHSIYKINSSGTTAFSSTINDLDWYAGNFLGHFSMDTSGIVFSGKRQTNQYTENSYDIVIRKVNYRGKQLWQSYYDFNNLCDYSEDLKIDNLGDIFMTTNSHDAPNWNTQTHRLVKINGKNGKKMYERKIGTTSGRNDIKIAKNNLFVSLYGDSILCIDTKTGLTNWGLSLRKTHNYNSFYIDTNSSLYVVYDNGVYKYSTLGILVDSLKINKDTFTYKHYGIQMDSLDNIFVYGVKERGTESKIFIAKFCKPNKHNPLSKLDTLNACKTLKLTTQNKKYKSYRWSTGDTTLSTIINNTGTITLKEINSKGCQHINTVYVRLLKDEIFKANDTTIYNLTVNDTIQIKPNKWFNSTSYDYYNSQKSKIDPLKIIYLGKDSTIWKGYASLKTNTNLKCPISGKIYTKQLPDYIPKDSLIGWYPFNGNANDLSGNGNNGTVNGASLSNDRYSNSNSAYGFINNGDRITLNSVKQVNIIEYTVCGWFKNPNRLGASFFSGAQFPNNIYGLQLGMDGNSEMAFAAENGTNSVATYSNISSYLDNNWHFFCVVFKATNGAIIDTSNLTIIIDNKILPKTRKIWGNQLLIKAPINNGGLSTVIGNNTYNYGKFEGLLDDFGLWNRALDSNEIKALYFGCKPKKHVKLTTADTLFECASLKLTSKNKKYKSHRWSNGDTTISSTIKNSGLVTILETDTNGCKNIDTVYVRILKDEISVAPDTSICNVKANDTLKLNLVKWFGKSDYDYFNSSKNKVQTADIFIKNSSTKIWKGSAALKTNNALKCPISGKVYPSVTYPRLVHKLTDTILTTTTSLKPALADKKYTKYRWSNGDSIFTTKYINSGNYWFQQTDSVSCSQTDSFHFSRINLTIPSRITTKFGVKMMLKVKDSTNASSFVAWSNGDTGWSTGYAVTKNVDTLYATQIDAYRSVTKFIVITKTSPKSLAQNQDYNLEYDTTNQDNDIPPKQAIETSNIRIYPNPVGSIITLEGLTSTNLKYEIYSVSGKLVQVGKALPKINVENLPTGLYLLKLENVAVKFVKE